MIFCAEAAARAGVSGREVFKLIERARNPEEHHWTFTKRERNAKMFELLCEAAPKWHPGLIPMTADGFIAKCRAPSGDLSVVESDLRSPRASGQIGTLC